MEKWPTQHRSVVLVISEEESSGAELWERSCCWALNILQISTHKHYVFLIKLSERREIFALNFVLFLFLSLSFSSRSFCCRARNSWAHFLCRFLNLLGLAVKSREMSSRRESGQSHNYINIIRGPTNDEDDFFVKNFFPGITHRSGELERTSDGRSQRAWGVAESQEFPASQV